MKVLILGGTGFIGHALSTYLQELGHDVYIGTRSPEKVRHPFQAIHWPLDSTGTDSRIDAVINLAGRQLINAGLKRLNNES